MLKIMDRIGNNFPILNLPQCVNLKQRANEELEKIVKAHQKQLEEATKETYNISSPFSYWHKSWGIGTDHIVFTPWEAIKIVVGDGDEDSHVKVISRSKALKSI